MQPAGKFSFLSTGCIEDEQGPRWVDYLFAENFKSRLIVGNFRGSIVVEDHKVFLGNINGYDSFLFSYN